MAVDAQPHPFELLLAIDRNSKHHAAGFPLKEEVREEWTGIAFRLREYALVAPMAAVLEVVTPLAMAQVPGVKPWVLGVANMRGILLPIMDLQGFLYGANTSSDPASQRVLVIRHERVSVGLLVDAVLGLKHFFADERSRELPELDLELSLYVRSSFSNGAERYAVFDIAKLVKSEPFMDVTV